MQTSVDDLAKGLEGQLADGGDNRVVSFGNSSKQVNRVTVDTPDNTQVFAVIINGTTFDITSDADATEAEISAALEVDINAGAEPVTAIDEVGSLRIVSDTTGLAFTITVTAAGVGVLSQEEIVANNAGIPFGRLLVQDPNQDDGALFPVVVGDIVKRNIIGVSVHTQAIEQSIQGNASPGYRITDTMSVGRKARIYVRVEEAVNPASIPHARHTAGVGGVDLGAIRASTDTDTAAPLPDDFRFIDSAGIDEIAILEYNLS